MIRMRKFYFAFSFAIILSLVIYASINYTGTTSLSAYENQDILPNKTTNYVRKGIISSIPIAAPSVDLPQIQKTSIINYKPSSIPIIASIVDIPRIEKTSIISSKSKVRNYSTIKAPIKTISTITKNGNFGILPMERDVRPFILNPEKYALNMARLKIRMEVLGVNSLSGFLSSKSTGLKILPPLNMEKKKVLLLTYWRSGSTFVGDILNQYPGTFYHFEPLHSVSGSDVINASMEAKAINFLSDLLNCDYSQQNDYLKWVKKEDNQFLFQHNSRLWSGCRIRARMCFNASFVSSMCNEFPFQVMKVTRVSLEPIMELLDQHPSLKIVYLVRDPRGMFSSRLSLDWCQKTKSCIDPKMVCDGMRRDLAAVIKIYEKYPNRLLLLRYEDVSLNPEERVKQLFKFLERNLHKNVLKYLKSHTHLKENEAIGGPYSTKRDSKMAAFAWKSKLKFSHVVTIQNHCSDIISRLGYKLIQSESELPVPVVSEAKMTVTTIKPK